MEKSNEQRVGDLIKRFMDRGNIQSRLLEHKAELAFIEAVGPTLAQRITEVRVSNQVMYIKVSIPAVRHELSYSKIQIRASINRKLNCKYISKLIFY